MWVIVEWHDKNAHLHGIQCFPTEEALDVVADPSEYTVRWTEDDTIPSAPRVGSDS
jgi:hypothetical protein